MRSLYDLEAVKPYREELTNVGVKPLTTPEEVAAIFDDPEGTMLLVINSVCGCAAGHARPGIGLALQHDRIPDRLYTVFAGVDREATLRAREHIPGFQPSSPSVALFKDGQLVLMLERRLIEAADAKGVADILIEAFDKYCTSAGPSVSRKVFESNFAPPRCSSTLPEFEG
jgi:putative YphP/YqiW family bacilliredoxin